VAEDLDLAATNIHAALWASPEAKAGMFHPHFEQVHRTAVIRTVLMGRNRALLDQDLVLRVQKIAVRPAVMDETIRFLAGVGHPIVT
jgi:hypothetical protein